MQPEKEIYRIDVARRRRRSYPVVSLFGIGLFCLGVGCERSTVTDGLSDSTDCSACHGVSGNPAPPKAVNGATSTTDIGVGAHTVHLTGSNIAGPVACTACHPMPTDYYTHPDVYGRPAEVLFGGLASANGAVPAWDRATATCRDTYCHGATLSGAQSRVAPLWTRVDGSQRNCAACHGFPPAGTHPASVLCESCHGDVAGPGGIIKNPLRHVDGVLDFGTATGSRQALPSSQRFALKQVNQRQRFGVTIGKTADGTTALLRDGAKGAGGS